MASIVKRVSLIQIARAALALLVVAIAVQARAMAISAPAGGTLPSNAPFVVQWVSTPGPGQIEIRLESNSRTFNLASGVANTGQTSVSFPTSAVCNPQEVFRIRVLRYVPVSNGITYPDQGYGAPFKFVCVAPTPPITVIKQIVNTTGVPAAGIVFQMRLQCDPAWQTMFNLSGPGNLQRDVAVPYGSVVCTVAEISAPRPAPLCQWLTTYPVGQQSPPGGTLIVVNELRCQGPLGGPRR